MGAGGQAGGQADRQADRLADGKANGNLAVEASGLCKTYRVRGGPDGPDRRALAGVDLRIAPGERVAILGPNGCGKSTLVQILTGAMRADDGSCSILGDAHPARRMETRARLGVVFQSPGLDPLLTVRENLETHARVCGLGRSSASDVADRAMAAFALTDRSDDRVSTLSGGLARRVDLARATLPVHADGPGLLILDEPTAGLDPSSRVAFRTALDRLAADWPTLAIVLTTHLFEDASWCERALLMNAGRLVADGTPDALTTAIGSVVVRVRGLRGNSDLASLLDSLGPLGGAAMGSGADAVSSNGSGRDTACVVFGAPGGRVLQESGALHETDIGMISRVTSAWCEPRGVAFTVGPVTLEEVYEARVGAHMTDHVTENNSANTAAAIGEVVR